MTRSAPYAQAFRQVAALPVRVAVDGAVEVLLVTSRDTGRWVIPKGWPMQGKTDWDAAATEAMEEAGVVGTIEPEPLGVFDYFKRRDAHFELIEVTVYRLEVIEQLPKWPEHRERHTRWFSAPFAASLVQEPGLVKLLLQFSPSTTDDQSAYG